MGARGERIFSALLRLYPRAFRQRYRDDLLAFFRQDREHPKYGSGLLRPARFWSATVRDLVRAAWGHRLAARAVEIGPSASMSRRVSGDLRYAWRGLWSSPGVASAALVVLTLGIGTSTAIFSVVDAVALRGLPFHEAARLMSVAETDLMDASRPMTVARQNFLEWRAQQRVFEGMAASASAGRFTTAGAPPAENLRAVRITASLFEVLRVAPAMGRPFDARDELTGAPQVAIISDGLWRRRFHARPDIIGQPMTFENGTWEIVGVMPRSFTYPIGSVVVSAVDFWVPFVSSPRDAIRTPGRTYSLTVVARLRSGETQVRAAAEMTRIRDALAVEHPRWFADRGIIVRPLQSAIVGAEVRSWMLLLLGAVGFVLLMACLNVANLLLARAVARSREVAVRAALGASPWDLARALLVESLMLSVLGSACGVLAAFWGVRILRATLPEHLPRLTEVGVDLRVLGVAALAALVTGVLFGTLPALQFSRPDVAGVLRQGGRSQSGGAVSERLRTILVLAEVALAVVLLAGAGLFISSFVRLMQIDLGLNPEHVLSVGVAPRSASPALERSAAIAAAHPLIMAALERTQAVPGVVAASALSSGLPLSGNSMSVPVQLPGQQSVFTGDDEAFVHGVTPTYLDVMRSTLIRGRWIEAGDVAGSPPVVVLSDEAVRRYFGSRDPMDQIIILNESPRTVVGIVHGVRLGGPESEVPPEAYIPFLQSDQRSADIVVRTGPDPALVAPHVQAAIRSVIPNAVVYEPQTLEQHFGTLVAQRKFNMIVLALFGSLAVVIASVGIYGLMAFVVAQRTREIGVRIALGAVPAGILQMVLGTATRLMVVGLFVGLAGAAALEQLVRAFLFDARAHDPAVYAAVAIVLLVTGLVAAFGPARRAARVDPLEALRAE